MFCSFINVFYKSLLLRAFSLTLMLVGILSAQDSSATNPLDQKVSEFLEEKRDSWRDMNVPEVDGKVLYDLIIKNNFTRALEIGTSTGHSAIWIAWALSKTGGRLITIDINRSRHLEALENFRDAGLAEYIDARLADAHDLVPALTDSFDFVFCDADKDWYTQYFKDVWPNITAGGCFTAHNVLHNWAGIREFLEYLPQVTDASTSIDKSSRSGISITYKKSQR